MISPSACLPRSATDQLDPLPSTRPAVSYTTTWDTIRGRVPDPVRLLLRLSPKQTALPMDVAVAHPSLDSFDALLEACV